MGEFVIICTADMLKIVEERKQRDSCNPHLKTRGDIKMEDRRIGKFSISREMIEEH